MRWLLLFWIEFESGGGGKARREAGAVDVMLTVSWCPLLFWMWHIYFDINVFTTILLKET